MPDLINNLCLSTAGSEYILKKKITQTLTNNNINDKQLFAPFWSAWYIRVIHVHRREKMWYWHVGLVGLLHFWSDTGLLADVSWLGNRFDVFFRVSDKDVPGRSLSSAPWDTKRKDWHISTIHEVHQNFKTWQLWEENAFEFYSYFILSFPTSTVIFKNTFFFLASTFIQLLQGSES